MALDAKVANFLSALAKAPPSETRQTEQCTRSSEQSGGELSRGSKGSELPSASPCVVDAIARIRAEWKRADYEGEPPDFDGQDLTDVLAAAESATTPNRAEDK